MFRFLYVINIHSKLVLPQNMTSLDCCQQPREVYLKFFYPCLLFYHDFKTYSSGQSTPRNSPSLLRTRHLKFSLKNHMTIYNPNDSQESSTLKA